MTTATRDELLERWCHRLWNTVERAKREGLDVTKPRDLLGPAVVGAARAVGRLSRRVRKAGDDLAAGRSGAEQKLAKAERDLAVAQEWLEWVREARLAAVAVDSWESDGLGPALRHDARERDAADAREYAAFTRAKLAENPVLAALLLNDGVEAVYRFADLTAGEYECVDIEHRSGLHPKEIARLTNRQQRTAEELLRRAHYKLRRLAAVPVPFNADPGGFYSESRMDGGVACAS